MASRTPFTCSFCGKARKDVGHLIAGPNGVYICGRCVALCNEIITENRQPPAVPTSTEQRRPERRRFRHWGADGMPANEPSDHDFRVE